MVLKNLVEKVADVMAKNVIFEIFVQNLVDVRFFAQIH